MKWFWPVRVLSVLLAFGGAFGLQALVVSAQQPLLSRLVVLAGLYVTLAVSLNLINGITGQFSMGHAAFYMVGAYLAAMTHNWALAPQGWPPLVNLMATLVVGALGAAVAGLVVGLPSLRLKGDYLAVVTLGFGEIIRIIVQNAPAIGGSGGWDIAQRIESIAVVWLLAILCIAVCRNLLRTAHGLPFLAVREDEIASAAMGVHVTRIKVIAFVLGAAFAGAAGAAYGMFEKFISPQQFPMELSFMVLTMVVLGGTGSITGSALAAVALFYLPERLRDMAPVSGAQILGGSIALILTVAVLKWLVDHDHSDRFVKASKLIGATALGCALAVGFSALLANFPALGGSQYEANRLRMVIFAATLIILMLLRPQGIFAHHEFSWSWVQKVLLRKKVPETEVWA